MGRLTRRVRRLERAPDRVVCPACRGADHTRMSFEVEGLRPDPPRACPGCGRDEPWVVRIGLIDPAKMPVLPDAL